MSTPTAQQAPEPAREPTRESTREPTREPTRPIRFTKMHGIGNCYLYVNGFDERVEDPAGLARAMSDAHTGVGADGLILVLPPDDPGRADVRMRIFNRDGSEAEMCGNGIRCVCKFAFERGLTGARPMRVDTGAGVRAVAYDVADDGFVHEASVDMGAPSFELACLPVDPARLAGGAGPAYAIDLGGERFEATFVSMGNPHAVVFVPDAAAVPLATVGPAWECHPAFPRRINTHFVEVRGPREVVMRTWERGSGATLACGTGAAAVCVAGVVTGRTERRMLARLPGGVLRLEWDEGTGRVTKSGPAEEIFEGVWPVSLPSPGPMPHPAG